MSDDRELGEKSRTSSSRDHNDTEPENKRINDNDIKIITDNMQPVQLKSLSHKSICAFEEYLQGCKLRNREVSRASLISNTMNISIKMNIDETLLLTDETARMHKYFCD